MNSRSAKNDASANSTSVIVGPVRNATARIADHHPPGVDARDEVGAARGLLFVRRRGVAATRRWSRRWRATRRDCRTATGIRWECCAGCSIMSRCSVPRARSPPRGRARERPPCLLPPASASGAPKRTVHTIGTGSSAPFGRLRCRLSRYTGTSSTAGNSLASRYSPLRKRAGRRVAAARAFGKDDQRVAVAQRGAQRLERIRVSHRHAARSMSTAPKPRVAMYLRSPVPQ